MEGHGIGGLEHRAFVDLGEALRIHPENLRVPLLRGAQRQTQVGLLVEDPARDALGVLAEQGPLARRDLDLVDVMPGGIAIVETDVDRVGIGLGHGIDHRPGPLGGGQVAGFGSLLACGGRGCGIHGIDVVVLVAILVLDEEDLFAVPAPEEAGDGPLGISSDETPLGVGLPHFLDPDVPGLLPGLEEGNPLPVRGQLGAGDLRIAEELVPIDKGRKLGLSAGGGGGSLDSLCGQRQNQGQGKA